MRKNSFIRQTGGESEVKVNIDFICSYEVYGDTPTNKGKCIIMFCLANQGTVNWIYKNRNDYGFRNDVSRLGNLLDYSEPNN